MKAMIVKYRDVTRINFGQVVARDAEKKRR